MSDQPALDSSRKLKDASEIVWYNDKDDDTPIGAPLPGGLSRTGVLSIIVLYLVLTCLRASALGRGHRVKHTSKLHELIAAERLDETGKVLPPKSTGQKMTSMRKPKKRRTDTPTIQTSSGNDDNGDFSATGSESDTGDEASGEEVTNEEASCLFIC